MPRAGWNTHSGGGDGYSGAVFLHGAAAQSFSHHHGHRPWGSSENPRQTVQEALGARAEQEELRIGNLGGVLPLMLQAQGNSLQSAAVIRTARRILEGSIYVAY